MITYNSQYFEMDGEPWFPVMGEYPYSRSDCRDWKEDLAKMKALGVDIVSSYCCWIHHEEAEGHFDFRGSKNLRRFAKEVKAAGMYLCLRVGPWVHAEVRNGGFPDWVENKKYRARSNDAGYMADVERYFTQLCAQCAGLTYKDGGPIVAVQVENEYSQWGVQGKGIGDEHIAALIALLKEKGMDVPLYFATGWGKAATGQAIPVWGNYCEAPWEAQTGELPPMDGYLFTDNPNDANIGSDTGRKEMDATIARSPYPYATVELGSGIQVTKIRRPVITGEDCGAMALCKIGSGVAMLGYYVFHGGINPTGAFTSMQEYRDEKNLRAGFCCDLPEFNYDFQAPVGQYGEIRPCGRELKLWNYLIRYFGRQICTLPVSLFPGNPSDPNDLHALRCAVRARENGGFVFFNNYVRHYPTKEKSVRSFSPVQGVTLPDFTLQSGQYCAFVFNREICGTRFRYALATPFCTLNEKDCVFWAEEGQGAIETEGDPAGKVILLSKQDAQNAWCFSYAGMDRLFVTDGEMYASEGGIVLLCGKNARLKIYPKPETPPCGFVCTGDEGVFGLYEKNIDVPSFSVQICGQESGDGYTDYVLKCKGPYGDVHAAHLAIGYEGDRLEILLDGEKVADDYYTGKPYVFGLRGYGYPSRITVRVCELRQDAFVYTEYPPAFMDGRACRLTFVRAEVQMRVLLGA